MRLVSSARTASLLAGLMLIPVLAVPAFSAARRNPAGFSASSIPANDDGSSPQVDIGFPVNLFGTTYNKLWVNNNGNVTFTASLRAFTPTPIVSVGIPIIAPFWADVDTRGAGSALTTYGNATVNGRNAFGVEWGGVGYFSNGTDKLNYFELVIIDRSDTGTGNFDLEFNYDQVKWETGGASGGSGGLGGSSVRVGYSNGSDTSFELPGSAVNGALLDSGASSLVGHSLNSPVLGRYVFSARNGAVNNTPGGSPVPLPPTIFLVGGGLAAYGLSRIRRRKA